MKAVKPSRLAKSPTARVSFLGVSMALCALCVSALSFDFSVALAPAQQEISPDQTELTVLVRGLHHSKSPSAYAALKRFAEKNAAQPLGPRAALALGHYDYASNRLPSAAQWLALAAKDPLLADYAHFWLAQVDRNSGRPGAALSRLEEMRAAHPKSGLAAEAAEALAQTALAAGQPEKTVALLASTSTDARPDLLFTRAQARERLGALAPAALDYSAVFYRFPLAPEAKFAGSRLNDLRAKLRAEFPTISPAWVATRVQRFLDEKKCSDGRRELDRLSPSLPAASRDQLRVRVVACQKKGAPAPGPLEKLKVADAEADAERLYLLSQAWRSKRNEARMMAVIEEAALRHPASRSTEDALFAAGNYFWTQLDHARAALYYQRLLDAFPKSSDAQAAHWRIAWQAYLENSPRANTRAAAQMEEHLRRFSGSPYSSNALYWLARLAERDGRRADARSFYLRVMQSYPQSYFSQVSAERLRQTSADGGSSDAREQEVFSALRDHGPAVSLSTGLTAETQHRRARAHALRSIDLDSYAERELLAAYQETRAPALLLDAAQIALEDSRYFNGVVLGRRLVPNLESRRLPDLPEELWRTLYPYVYGEGIRSTAQLAGLDPMLVAGLIRQESVFHADAVSRAGACGLMQVMPRTGRELARELRLSYARKKLFQPEFNMRLGTTHLAKLVRRLNSLEAALAAYNAGEYRVSTWQAGRTYSEPAEFVETIPFSETREYVQVILRNREIYRSLYGNNSSTAAAATPSPSQP